MYHSSGRLVRQLAGSSRYPKRMKGPAIAGGYLFDERKFFMRFVYEPLPYRVIFGAGTLNQVGEELQHVGRRALVLSTPEKSEERRAGKGCDIPCRSRGEPYH